MNTPPNGQPSNPEDTVSTIVVDATTTLKSMMDTFVRTAQLANYPAPLVGSAGFGLTLQLIILNTQNSFYANVLSLLGEMVERTRAEGGGLDMKAIQREMTQRKIDVAMGPDTEMLQHLVMGGNHAQSIQDQELADLRGQLDDVRTWVQAMLEGQDTPQETRECLRDLEQYLRPSKGQDPGAVPQDVRTDGGL